MGVSGLSFEWHTMEEAAVQARTQRLAPQAAAICGDVGCVGDATSGATPRGSCTALCHSIILEPTHVFATS